MVIGTQTTGSFSRLEREPSLEPSLGAEWEPSLEPVLEPSLEPVRYNSERSIDLLYTHDSNTRIKQFLTIALLTIERTKNEKQTTTKYSTAIGLQTLQILQISSSVFTDCSKLRW